MATLVLSTVGTAVGGPVGGAIGALIGQSIDQQLLGGGPKVGDLSVQTSSYGTQIPRIYGTMRVAGTIIWATDLKNSGESAAVKGQADGGTGYSISIAVALSSRPITAIRRIWADGKLLRGESGDLKVAGKLRIYDGSDDQVVDAFIASAEGVANTPAYRGLALAVFEDLDLGPFGNRIPFMTFEVVADEVASISTVFADATDGTVVASGAESVVGYAAYGQSMRAAIEPLVECFGAQLVDDGQRLTGPADDAIMVVGADELGSSAGGESAGRVQTERAPVASSTGCLRVEYYDPAREFQAGEARAVAGESSAKEVKRELPAAVEAAAAKSLAQQMLAREWATRDRMTLRLPPHFLSLCPGDRVSVSESSRVWTVEQCTVDGFVVVAELRPSFGPVVSIAADAGRIVPNSDVVAGDLVLALFDIPDVLGTMPSVPNLWLAASSPTPGWAAARVGVKGGAYSASATTAPRKSLLGRALTALPAGQVDGVDQENSVDVELVDHEQWPLSCDSEALAGGANVAALGSEVFQFGDVLPLGQGRFRLSRLMRGRACTEWAIGSHSVGDDFVLFSASSLAAVSMPAWAIGSTVEASAENLSGRLSAASILATGESVRPPSPTAVQAARGANGDLSITWTRRVRAGLGWSDGAGTLGTSRELYRVGLVGTASSAEFEAGDAQLAVAADTVNSLGSGTLRIEVRQVGDLATSHPGSCELTL